MTRWSCVGIAVMSLLALGAKGQNAATLPTDSEATPSVFCSLESYAAFNLKKYEKNFLGSLEYPANEIVEAGLAQIAMLKLAQPQTPCNKLKRKIDDLALNGATATVRYKAYLTNMVFEHPELFESEKYGLYLEGDDLFRALSERLSLETLAVH
ncbi:MAG: hypothetical protein HY961_10195 [Ignavibacteriae bacterium]|nr:hypothetical protein [Ignavibacteriota bacterium]